MSTQLPAVLRARLDGLLEGVSRRELAERSDRLSALYRATGSARFHGRGDLIAYAVARMPATFAAISAALGWTFEGLADWRPRTLLDLGSGPGTAIWAARELWPEIDAVVAVEHDEGMRGLAEELAGTDNSVRRLDHDIADPAKPLPRSELVIAAYVLGELAEAVRAGVLDRAWSAAEGVLLLVEPGTPVAASRIGAARTQLIQAGATIIAPCPNALACPMTSPGWCHFPARLARSRAHMATKGATVPFEDEKFSYVAFARMPAPAKLGARIVGPPVLAKPHIHLSVCQDGQINPSQVPRHDRPAFRHARKLGWGDVLPRTTICND